MLPIRLSATISLVYMQTDIFIKPALNVILFGRLLAC